MKRGELSHLKKLLNDYEGKRKEKKLRFHLEGVDAHDSRGKRHFDDILSESEKELEFQHQKILQLFSSPLRASLVSEKEVESFAFLDQVCEEIQSIDLSTPKQRNTPPTPPPPPRTPPLSTPIPAPTAASIQTPSHILRATPPITESSLPFLTTESKRESREDKWKQKRNSDEIISIESLMNEAPNNNQRINTVPFSHSFTEFQFGSSGKSKASGTLKASSSSGSSTSQTFSFSIPESVVPIVAVSNTKPLENKFSFQVPTFSFPTPAIPVSVSPEGNLRNDISATNFGANPQPIQMKRPEDVVSEATSTIKDESVKNHFVFLEFEINESYLGKVICKLYNDLVPLTTENFRVLCTGEKGFGYKRNRIHRIVKNFVVQGGDITKGDGTGGRSIYEKTPLADVWGNFKDEAFYPHNKAGILSMANSGKNTNRSQFFITLKPCPKLDGKHVAFGEVIEGMNFIQKISEECDPKTDHVIIRNCGTYEEEKNISSAVETKEALSVSPVFSNPVNEIDLSSLEYPPELLPKQIVASVDESNIIEEKERLSSFGAAEADQLKVSDSEPISNKNQSNVEDATSENRDTIAGISSTRKRNKEQFSTEENTSIPEKCEALTVGENLHETTTIKALELNEREGSIHSPEGPHGTKELVLEAPVPTEIFVVDEHESRRVDKMTMVESEMPPEEDEEEIRVNTAREKSLQNENWVENSDLIVVTAIPETKEETSNALKAEETALEKIDQSHSLNEIALVVEEEEVRITETMSRTSTQVEETAVQAIGLKHSDRVGSDTNTLQKISGNEKSLQEMSEDLDQLQFATISGSSLKREEVEDVFVGTNIQSLDECMRHEAPAQPHADDEEKTDQSSKTAPVSSEKDSEIILVRVCELSANEHPSNSSNIHSSATNELYFSSYEQKSWNCDTIHQVPLRSTFQPVVTYQKAPLESTRNQTFAVTETLEKVVEVINPFYSASNEKGQPLTIDVSEDVPSPNENLPTRKYSIHSTTSTYGYNCRVLSPSEYVEIFELEPESATEIEEGILYGEEQWHRIIGEHQSTYTMQDKDSYEQGYHEENSSSSNNNVNSSNNSNGNRSVNSVHIIHQLMSEYVDEFIFQKETKSLYKRIYANHDVLTKEIFVNWYVRWLYNDEEIFSDDDEELKDANKEEEKKEGEEEEEEEIQEKNGEDEQVEDEEEGITEDTDSIGSFSTTANELDFRNVVTPFDLLSSNDTANPFQFALTKNQMESNDPPTKQKVSHKNENTQERSLSKIKAESTESRRKDEEEEDEEEET